MSTFRPRSRLHREYDLLPPDRPKARLASDRLARPANVEDAEFTVIGQAQPLWREQSGRAAARPGNDNRGRPASRPDLSATTLEGPRARRAKSGLLLWETGLRRLSDNLFSALVAAVFLIVFALSGGLSALAMGGGDVTVPAVEITHVTVTPKRVNGLDMLVVNGVIENHGAAVIDSPRLDARVYAGSTLMATTLFRTRTGAISTGESRGFQVKLPQSGAKSVDVRVLLAE